jgi:multidrug efflux system membrane fusion protein
MDTRPSNAFEAISTGVQDAVPERWRRAAERNSAWFWAAGLAILAALVWYFFFSSSPPPAKPKAVSVTVAKVVTANVPVSITAIGAAQAWTSVTILAQVSGKLLTVNFAEGTDVKAGQVLAQIDPAPYRAALLQAEGALKRDQALLANARIDLARYKALVAQNAVSQQVYATQAALVKQDEGTVLLDQGQVDAANVNLGWTRITAPVTGRVGVRLVDPGNLVSASGSIGSTPATASSTSNAPATSTSSSGIVIVNQIEPMAVTFTVPQGQFQRLVDLSDSFRKPLATKAFSQETGESLGGDGQLSIADNRVDPSTGTVQLKARFPNTSRKLWPGQFINVELTLQVLSNATTVPATAVNQGPNGAFLYVVGTDKKVTMRPVTVAWTQGDTAVIKDGEARAGETVVTDGQMILKPGSLVRIIKPANAASKRQTT